MSIIIIIALGIMAVKSTAMVVSLVETSAESESHRISHNLTE